MRFARRYWKHLIAGHALLAGIVIGILFAVGVFTGTTLYSVYGQKLDKKGLVLYQHLAKRHDHSGLKKFAPGESLPPAVAKRIRAHDATVPTLVPRTLATPEPVTYTSILDRNYSSRNGAKVLLWMVHDAEMPSSTQLRGLHAINGWFNNPQAQASSNYSTDAFGNSVLMVKTTDKAWTQAFFNSNAISDELLGYASQLHWPEVQLRAAALLAAHDSITYGIPVQLGKVSGCTILRAGFLQHNDLGPCGGGHHDAGPHFPMGHFIALVAQYRTALIAAEHPKPAPKPKPKPVLVSPTVLKAKTGEWSWIAWRFGQAAWKGYPLAAAAVRPNVSRTIPAAWWHDAAKHGGH